MLKKSSSFTLHPQLKKDSIFIVDLPISQVRLINDVRFPWVVLVPRKPDLRELHDLTLEELSPLIGEISLASKIIQHSFSMNKINVAAIGNIVPQLHIHVVGRKKTDALWPKPVWGQGVRIPYEKKEAKELIQELEKLFNLDTPFR